MSLDPKVDTPEAIAQQLRATVEDATPRLRALDVAEARRKSAPDAWSIQEILGHLVDSAANNHQRFLRAQEGGPLVFPKYEQNHWVRAQGYNDSPWPDLIDLWRLYNLHLAQVMERIVPEALETECRIGPFEPVTLGFLMEDYVVHLRHHLAVIEGKGKS